MKGRHIVSVCCIAFLVGPFIESRSLLAQSVQQPPRPFRVYDEGQVSCGHYVEARKSSQILVTDVRSLQAEEWASGFLTAYNLYAHPRGDVAGTPDLDGAYAWLDRYCQQHPTTVFMTAVLALIDYL